MISNIQIIKFIKYIWKEKIAWEFQQKYEDDFKTNKYWHIWHLYRIYCTCKIHARKASSSAAKCHELHVTITSENNKHIRVSLTLIVDSWLQKCYQARDGRTYFLSLISRDADMILFQSELVMTISMTFCRTDHSNKIMTKWLLKRWFLKS